ncbi:MAG: phosphoribosylamine--glycine ligase [Candidatus Omnitrophica bacterium]|nr:phosphoribosylamine--glycine ligase [Candidatus Omnitrophota bacterium]
MRILVIGSGGREHTLVWKISQSSMVEKIYCAPGNGGIAALAECVDIPVSDIDALLAFARDNKIDLTVVGPEAPLVDGLVDVFSAANLKVFGPSKAAARLEGSKVFSKEFMYEYGIPTAPFITFSDSNDAKSFLNQAEYPLVVKADGLAAGKGVIICKDVPEAEQAIDQIMEEKIFHEAGNQIVLEECLVGEEVSILAICDGDQYVILESSQDHKRIFDDDLGPNTGGMGAYSPAPILHYDIAREIEESIIDPVVRGMKNEDVPFKGVLYAGLMITAEGPMVLEFNVRFGDPETQAVLPRLKSDLVEIMLASIDGSLDKVSLEWDSRTCLCVVMTSGGYPGKYDKNLPVAGLGAAGKIADTIVFHAGTKKENDQILTAGGRVLGVTGFGDGVEQAIETTYRAVERISFDHCFFRRDIGARALKRIGQRAMGVNEGS